VGAGLVIEAALIVPVGLAGRRWRYYERYDLDDRKIVTARKVLRILRADIPRDALVSLTVDFRVHTRGARQERNGPVTKYEHAWLALETPLADGNVVRLGVTEYVKRKVKRRATREQWQTYVEVGLRLAKLYGPATEVQTHMRQRPAPAPFQLLRIRNGSAGGRENRLSAELCTRVAPNRGQLIGGDELLAVLRWAYAGLAEARRGA
jgi:hypothetical protein